ncbi:MAG: ribonuclease E/G [Firmicutes bacterium]|nr:ribonuclease E/G [Bacillota bacterium]
MNKVYAEFTQNSCRALLKENDDIKEYHIFELQNELPLPGDIYVGVIEKKLPSGIYFINIGKNEPVFLQLSKREEALLKGKREILIQIQKEAVALKRATATTAISLTGKYTVVINDGSGIGISRKITEKEERERLENTARILPSRFGVIMRTNCQGEESEKIKEEITQLSKKLQSIEEKALYTKAPCCIQKREDEFLSFIRDVITEPCHEVVLNSSSYFDKTKEMLAGVCDNITLLPEYTPVFKEYFINEKLNKLLSRKVMLKNGGFLVIDETEAMTVIDVNSGKATQKSAVEKTNTLAAKEIARQLRLRNTGGIIIVDFIDQKGEKQNLISLMEECVKQDRIRTNVIGMTELSLMQLTRQKSRKPLSFMAECSCPLCLGKGKIKNNISLIYDIIGEIHTIFQNTIYNGIEIFAENDIIEGLNREKTFLENIYSKKITLTEKKLLSTKRYRIEFLK